MEYTVYLRTNLINGKQYVGQTKNLKKRDYYWNCLKTRYANKILTEEREKYGLENFKTDILAECDTQEEAWELEQRYIAELGTKYPAGYNMCNGGKTSEGTIFTEESKKNMSEAHKGCKPWLKGKHHTEEAKEKMRKSHKGKKPWNKGVKGLASPMKGKHHTEEAKEKNRQAHLGKVSKKRIPVVQLDLDGNFIREWDSECEASRNGYIQGKISACCRGERKTHGGFQWYYKENYEALKKG